MFPMKQSTLNWSWNNQNSGTPCFLGFADTAFFRNEGLWQPCIEEVHWHCFCRTIFSPCVCATFGDRSSISIITAFVMVSVIAIMTS